MNLNSLDDENLLVKKHKDGINYRLFALLLLLIVLFVSLLFFFYQKKLLINKKGVNVISGNDESTVIDDENSPFGDFVDNSDVDYRVSGRSRFPESGKVMEHNEEILFIYSVDNSVRPFFEKIENRNKYPSDKYEVVVIPEQDSIKYIAGYFEYWEDIPGTLDKYMIIKYPPLYESLKFRVSFQKSDLFSNDFSRLFYETYNLDENGMYVVEPYDLQYNDFISLTFDRVKGSFTNGDYIIVVPYFDPPQYNKKDEFSNYLVSQVYIRK